MTEAGYQSKIIKGIEALGGVAINGKYTITGTADLICGYPIVVEELVRDGERSRIAPVLHLYHLHVEVKTEKAYNTLMKNHIKEVNGSYVVDDNYNGREVLQAFKLNEVRKKGGKALFAWNIEQVISYMEENDTIQKG